MKSLKESINEDINNVLIFNESTKLYEKLITFNNKVYPKFGNIVVLAGGAGSGKGFVISNLLGIEGKVFDVDAIKQLLLNPKLKNIPERILKDFGVKLSELNLKTPSDVSLLHRIADDIGITSEIERVMFFSIIEQKDRKPNIIFDVTLKDLRKLYNISEFVTSMGYDKKNIHICWVLNDIEIAKQQNKKRDRVVPEEILINTHSGVAMTMNQLINTDIELTKYMDGDIWIAFNKVNVDTSINKSIHGGFSIKDANILKIKETGKKVNNSLFTDEINAKIRSYIPDTNLFK